MTNHKEFGETLMTGYVMGALLLAELPRDYDIECDANVIQVTNKANGAQWRVTVDFAGVIPLPALG